MITQDAETFVALGRAVALAALEGALDEDEAADLAAALVAGILTGCMEMDTYARVHDALARLLERAFAGEVRPVAAAAPDSEVDAEEPLGVYLEVVGEAWEKVNWQEEACAQLRGFVRRTFDLGSARFGEGAWFRAPLRVGTEELLAAARGAGLLVISREGALPSQPSEASIAPAEDPASAPRVVLGWGERRAAVALA